jgi:hypothetical protein
MSDVPMLARDWIAPESCHEEVIRTGETQPCDKPSVAMRYDPEKGTPYPVCVDHCRADMVPLTRLGAEYVRELAADDALMFRFGTVHWSQRTVVSETLRDQVVRDARKQVLDLASALDERTGPP